MKIKNLFNKNTVPSPAKFGTRDGFTIVELLVVVTVIAILTTVAIVSYSSLSTKARTTTVKSDLNSTAKKLDLYNAETGAYPSALSSLNNNNGPTYSPGTTYQYTYTSASNSYCLTVTNNTISYYISSLTKVVAAGACAGHVAGGGTITYTVQVSAWGGGGSGFSGYSGGGGGSAQAIVSSIAAGSYPVIVGDGGVGMAPSTGAGPYVVGGGGLAGGIGWSGQGGGYSGMFLNSVSQSNALLIASGGGGAGANASAGAGGDQNGLPGTGSNAGTGATQSAGGFNPYGGNGSALQGGDSMIGTVGDSGGGGGGGGGYFGGGAGFNGDSPAGNSGGGGGSGYCSLSAIVCILYNGSWATTGNPSDAQRGTAGSAGLSGANGSAGKLIVTYITGSMSATGGTITTSGIYTIHTFTASGTFTVL